MPARVARSSASVSARRTSGAGLGLGGRARTCAQAVTTPTSTGTPLRDHVEDRRARLGALDDLAQLLGRGVALDAEADADALEAVAVRRRRGRGGRARPCRPRAPTRPRSAARRGRRRRRPASWSGRRRARAAGTRPGWRRCRCRAGSAGSPASSVERLLARDVLLAGAVEVLDRGAVVGAVDPVVAARNWKMPSSGLALMASSVPYICSVSTPLRMRSRTLRHGDSLGRGGPASDRVTR